MIFSLYPVHTFSLGIFKLSFPLPLISAAAAAYTCMHVFQRILCRVFSSVFQFTGNRREQAALRPGCRVNRRVFHFVSRLSLQSFYFRERFSKPKPEETKIPFALSSYRLVRPCFPRPTPFSFNFRSTDRAPAGSVRARSMKPALERN